MGTLQSIKEGSKHNINPYLRIFATACLVSVFVTVLFQVLVMSTSFRSISPFWLGKLPNSHKFHKENHTTFCTRWIVITSISYPTPQVRKLSQIPGWQVLVVGDKETPKDWASDGAIFLDPDAQLELGYEVTKTIPWNSYARKIVGYLYAIQNGAELIFDTEDWNAPEGNASIFEEYFALDNRTEMRGLIVQPETYSKVKNPYFRFGEPTFWPRGYPLDDIKEYFTPTYTACRSRPPAIRQGLVNGNPDVTALLRTRKRKMEGPFNINFDSRAPPVIFPQDLFAPFNSQNTVFSYDAFWALVIPISVPSRVADIWRGYWAQPLLWKTGNHLGFFPPHSKQLSNTRDTLKDLAEEIRIYEQAGDLVDFLGNWTCQIENSDLYSCMLELTKEMVNQEFLGKDDVNLTLAWIKDLKSIGYKAPSIINNHNISNVTSAPPCLLEVPKSSAIFHGVEEGTRAAWRRGKMRQQEILSYCNLKDSINVTTRPLQFPSTLLVVIFNFPQYENIWLLDLLYKPHFPNILYCGEMNETRVVLNLSSHVDKTNRFSFIHANVTKGILGYECTLRAMDMGYRVDNYLTLSDDVLLNFWALKDRDYDVNEVWVNVPGDTPRMEDPETRWKWWDSEFGRTGLVAMMNELSRISEGEGEGGTVRQFIKNTETYEVNNSVAWMEDFDIFSVPKSKQEAFSKVGWVVAKHKIFFEFAVPFLVSGLSPTRKFNETKVHIAAFEAVRPFKLSDLKNLAMRRQFCKDYVIKALLQ